MRLASEPGDRPHLRASCREARGREEGHPAGFLEPSLATLADTAPEGAEWIHEIKFDGYRLQARIEGDQVKLLTRKGLDWTAKFSGIAQSSAGAEARRRRSSTAKWSWRTRPACRASPRCRRLSRPVGRTGWSSTPSICSISTATTSRRVPLIERKIALGGLPR